MDLGHGREGRFEFLSISISMDPSYLPVSRSKRREGSKIPRATSQSVRPSAAMHESLITRDTIVLTNLRYRIPVVDFMRNHGNPCFAREASFGKISQARSYHRIPINKPLVQYSAYPASHITLPANRSHVNPTIVLSAPQPPRRSRAKFLSPETAPRASV